MIVPTMPPATFTVKGWPDSSWNGGRLQIGRPAGLRSEHWPLWRRNRWPLSVGICNHIGDSIEYYDDNNRFQVVSVRDLWPSVIAIYGTSMITTIGHIGKSRNNLKMRPAVILFLSWLSSVAQPGEPEHDVMVGLCDKPLSRPSYADASVFLKTFNSVVARWSREGTESDGRPLKTETQSTLFLAFDVIAGQH